MDFSALSTAELKRQSLERAEDLRRVTDAAFDAMVPAFLACIPLCFVCVLIFGGWLGDWQYVSRYVVLLLPIATGIAWPFYMRWEMAIQECKKFTKEMNERREEMARRRRDG